MNRKYACYAGLLVALLGSNALAQTRPKKRASKTVAVPESVPERRQTYTAQEYGIDPSTPILPIEEPIDQNRVYTYVEQMPTLNGQNAFTASIAAIHRSLVVPPAAPDGRVYVSFEVDKEGRVCHPRIEKGLRADVDSAIIAATRQLPPFVPGQQAGRAVAVSIVVPVTISVKK
ncbi:energy transducer TonB [Hymenobacter arizonensis]|uniref:TonB protein C-terminal n=1 Tax=Hymenobacter arizonensis TaxID=1227077 RepID=A0A1I6BNF7_HYMAR|nr:energy transducer TonB [Hymenobacter arizonensis]SFQ82470.1 TonB protein C-terminal [Hymenobacter arizonensis]